MTAYYGPALEAELAYRRERLQPPTRVRAARPRHLLRRRYPVR